MVWAILPEAPKVIRPSAIADNLLYSQNLSKGLDWQNYHRYKCRNEAPAMLKLFVRTVYVNSNTSVAAALAGYLRGQWVNVNGMKARIVNHTRNRVVLWMQDDKMIAVFP